VNAGFEQLRLLKKSLSLLPEGIEKVYLRSDSAGYQEDLLRYCAEGRNERFGKIEFAIAARVTNVFKAAVAEIDETSWQTITTTDEDGNVFKTKQEWAEVCFVPTWACKSKADVTYRYIAIREVFKCKEGTKAEDVDVGFQVVESGKQLYKLFAIVTNRKIEGNELIAWHRKRCGKSEAIHSIQKGDLAGGTMPSNRFGVNAAWWQVMILALNINRLMQLSVLPEELKEKRMKGMRYHLICLPGRLIEHARRIYLRVEQEAYAFIEEIRRRISELPEFINTAALNST